jgi:hypothetical protein
LLRCGRRAGQAAFLFLRNWRPNFAGMQHCDRLEGRGVASAWRSFFRCFGLLAFVERKFLQKETKRTKGGKDWISEDSFRARARARGCEALRLDFRGADLTMIKKSVS